MFVRFTELVQTSGFYERSQEIVRDASVVDGIEPAELEDYGGPCCVLRTSCDEEPIAVAGSLDDVLALFTGVEVSAAEKLDAIREIVGEGDNESHIV